jgi:putative SbcD/Mre11-related phosphoesterase
MVVVHDWILTPQRLAIHQPTRTAVAADLHLGYVEARRQSGEAVPAVPLETELEELGRACRVHAVRRLIIAGDLVEDSRTPGILHEFRAWLDAMGIKRVGIVPGNHDEHVEWSAEGLFQMFLRRTDLGGWHVAHGHERMPEGRVVHGHEHPCVGVGGGWRVPCYLVAEDRVILPAYSRDAAGVNVLRVRRWAEYRCYAVAEGAVLDLGPVSGIRRGLRGRGAMSRRR